MINARLLRLGRRRCRRGRHKIALARSHDHTGGVTAYCARPSCTYRSPTFTMPFAETKAAGGSFRGVRREDR